MGKKRRKHSNRQTNTTVTSGEQETPADLSAAENSQNADLTAEAAYDEAAAALPESAPEQLQVTESAAEEPLYEEEAHSSGSILGETFHAPSFVPELPAEEEEDVFAHEALSDTVPIDIDEIDAQLGSGHGSDHGDETDRSMFRKNSKSKNTKKNDNDDASLGAFFSDLFSKIRDFVVTQKRACIIAAAALLCCIGVIALAGKLAKKDAADNPVSVSDNTVGELLSVSGAPLEEDAYPEVNDLINRYFTARKNGDHAALQSILSTVDDMKLAQVDAINEYISDFTDIKCFTKQGPYENSYIVYATYNCTFKEWEEHAAPALLALLVCTDEQGNLFIESGEIDDEAAEFLKTVSAQQDVVDLFNRINTEYQEVIDADTGFAAYMEELKPKIARDVSVRVAELRENEEPDEGTGSGEVTPENGDEPDPETEHAEEPEEPEETANEETGTQQNGGTFLVETTTAVNVRKSDSENADRIAQVAGGTQLTCIEQRANGWSHVIYNDEDGYIKSDYVRVVGDDNNTTTSSNSKITVTSTVNVRDSASINGAVVGMAYAGESFELIERGAEWTKIVFNGKTAYVKSDYVSN